MRLSDLYNPIVKWVLRSPLHGIVSGVFMLITFTGRKSGKVYTTPVEYFHDGDTLVVFAASERVWWRNLQGGAPVTVRVKGSDYEGAASVTTGDAGVFARAFQVYLRRFPGRGKYFGVGVGSDGQPNPEDVARVAQEKVIVRIQLAS